MTVLVFATPRTSPEDPGGPAVPVPTLPPKWTGYVMTWTGADGSVWRLDGSDGVLLIQEGLVGLHMPGWDRYTSTSPAKAGSRHRGSRAKDRNVEWSVLVYSDESSAAWRDTDRAFWDSFDPDLPGTWTVTDPKGRALSLQCRFVGPDDFGYDRDPGKRGWQMYQVQLVAVDPFWTGDPVDASWETADPVEFFDPAGVGLHIANGASTADATMTNPGDEPAWLEWTVTGPMTSLALTVDEGRIELPPLDAGDVLVVNTDPTEATAILNGDLDVSGSVSPWDPRPVPAGRDVPISIDAVGFGTIAARLTPKYRRGV